MASFGEGDAVKDLLWFLAIIAVIGILWVVNGGPERFEKSGDKGTSSSIFSVPNILPRAGDDNDLGSNDARSNDVRLPSDTVGSQSRSRDQEKDGVDSNESVYKDQITLRLGRSGELTNNINEEYVVLTASARNKNPVTITGWKINNGNDAKTYLRGSGLVYGRPTVVVIPQGTLLLTGKANSLGSIMLQPGEKAYVITGRVPVQTSFKIDASFKTNKCIGYVAKLPNYRFTPTLSSRCPAYSEEINAELIPDKCLAAVKRFGTSCLTPKVVRDEEEGTSINDRAVPTGCRDLITENFSYALCVANHKTDEDFLGKTWYVYLDYGSFPIYPRRGTTITLYDTQNKIVDTFSY